MSYDDIDGAVRRDRQIGAALRNAHAGDEILHTAHAAQTHVGEHAGAAIFADASVCEPVRQLADVQHQTPSNPTL